MKRIITFLLILTLLLGLCACGAKAPGASKSKGPIKIGIVNNPPSESGYRAANVADFEKFSRKRKDTRSRPSTA